MKNTCSILVLLIASATATIIFQSHAAILVKDSFDAAGYSTVGASLKGLTAGESTGFAGSSKWGDSSSTGVFFVNDGLSLPDDFIASASGNAIGVGKFVGTSTGSREISRQINADVIQTSGTYYLRFACAISESAEQYLNFKGFELLGLLPIEHKSSNAISYPASDGLQFGFYKLASGDNKTALVVLKEGGSNASEGLLKLVDPVVPGKTYIVVAKIVLDGEGGADVYAMAGATDDLSFRTKSLPETPFTVSVDATKQLRHLVLSGTFMTGYGDGRWASFDELAIGESLGDVFGFEALTIPVLGSASSSNIDMESFSASGELAQTGSNSPEVFFDISTDGGETYTSTSLGVFNAAGPISRQETGLYAGTTYSWRFRAVGATGSDATDWQSVTLAGAPSFGEPTAEVSGNSATISISLVTPGLSGTADTTVELWFAAGDSPLALNDTLGTSTTPHNFATTVGNLALGGAYRYAFRATVPYNSGVIERWTATNSFTTSADIVWTGANGNNWNDAANWDPQLSPAASVSTFFNTVGGDVVSVSDGTAAAISVNTTGAGTAFDFGANSLTADSFKVGSNTSRSLATLEQGEYAFGDVSVGFGSDVGGVKTGSVECHLEVGSGAELNAGSMVVGYPLEFVSASNTVTFASGSKTAISGPLAISAARGSLAEVANGASLTVGSLAIESTGAALIVDGGTFTNSGDTVVMTKNRFGTTTSPTVLELKNGAKGKFNSHIYVNTGRNSENAIVHGELRVLSGSSADMSGKQLIIDSGAQNGPASDVGGGVRVVVSNATLTVNAVMVCNDDRHHDDMLLVHEDEGESASVTAGGNFRIASATTSRSDICNYNHRLRVESGMVKIYGSLFIGDGGPYYNIHDSNRVEIAGTNPRITAKTMNVYGKSFIDYEIPVGGYVGTPLSITETASFGDVPSGQDAETWVPVNGIRVDASNFIGIQTLLHAGSITGLTADRVIVTGRNSADVSVSVTETDVIVNVKRSGFSIIIR